MNFTKPLSPTGLPIRCLWERNGRFYAQYAVKHGRTKRVPLRAKTLDKAVSELGFLKHTNGTIEPKATADDTFTQIVQTYLSRTHFNKPATAAAEASCLKRACGYLGHIPIANFTIADLEDYRAVRLNSSIAASTANIELVIVGKILNYAHSRKLLAVVPKLKALRVVSPEKRLLTHDEIEYLHLAVNDGMFSDYLRLLQYTGCREQEALRLTWIDVEFSRGRLHVGSDGNSKNGRSRYIEFNDALKVHLEKMHADKGEDKWLFQFAHGLPPSSFRWQLNKARKEADMGFLGFHHFRHAFISQCVMSGIDFATIARWAGHSDGGTLVAKTYAHLRNDYVVSQAQKLTFK